MKCVEQCADTSEIDNFLKRTPSYFSLSVSLHIYLMFGKSPATWPNIVRPNCSACLVGDVRPNLNVMSVSTVKSTPKLLFPCVIIHFFKLEKMAWSLLGTFKHLLPLYFTLLFNIYYNMILFWEITKLHQKIKIWVYFW